MMLLSIWFVLKMVGTSRDSRDTAYLLALRCPDFFKRSRDSRDKLSDSVHRRPIFWPPLQNAARKGFTAAHSLRKLLITFRVKTPYLCITIPAKSHTPKSLINTAAWDFGKYAQRVLCKIALLRNNNK